MNFSFKKYLYSESIYFTAEVITALVYPIRASQPFFRLWYTEKIIFDSHAEVGEVVGGWKHRARQLCVNGWG